MSWPKLLRDVKPQRIQPPFGLDDEAIKAVRGWRFEPARQRGTPVAVVVPVELSFSLR